MTPDKIALSTMIMLTTIYNGFPTRLIIGCEDIATDLTVRLRSAGYAVMQARIPSDALPQRGEAEQARVHSILQKLRSTTNPASAGYAGVRTRIA